MIATTQVSPAIGTNGFTVKSDMIQVNTVNSYFNIFHNTQNVQGNGLELFVYTNNPILDGYHQLVVFDSTTQNINDVWVDTAMSKKDTCDINISNSIKFIDIQNHIFVKDAIVTISELTSNEMIESFRGYGSIECEPLEINVETNIVDGGDSGGGSGLEGYILKINKQQYIELKFNLVANLGVDTIVGLPSGLTFKNNTLYGTPLNGGVYPIIYYMTNGATIDGVIVVSRLTRIN